MKFGTLKGRILSGGASTGLRIFLIFISQVALTPVLLTYWGAEDFGLWLIFFSLTPLVQILDQAYQTYVGNEFLKIGYKKQDEINLKLTESLFFSGAVNIVLCFVFFTIYVVFFGNKENSSLAFLLFLHYMGWFILGAPSALLIKFLTCYGFYARFGWLLLCQQVCLASVPLVIAPLGGGVKLTIEFVILVTILSNVAIFYFALNNAKSVGFIFVSNKVKFRYFYKGYINSLVFALGALSENLKNQGMRIIVAPLLSVVDVVVYSTIRTGANVAYQGVSIVAQPATPEVLTFLRERDLEKINGYLEFMQKLVVHAVLPMMALMQAVFPLIFDFWTKGKVDFHPGLFFVFSVCIGLYVAYQSLLIIIQGQNAVSFLWKLYALQILSTLALSAIFVSAFGLLGASLGILISELMTVFFVFKYAQLVFEDNCIDGVIVEYKSYVAGIFIYCGVSAAYLIDTLYGGIFILLYAVVSFIWFYLFLRGFLK